MVIKTSTQLVFLVKLSHKIFASELQVLSIFEQIKLWMDFFSSSLLVAVDLILMEGCLFSFPFILHESAKIASNGSESAL